MFFVQLLYVSLCPCVCVCVYVSGSPDFEVEGGQHKTVKCVSRLKHTERWWWFIKHSCVGHIRSCCTLQCKLVSNYYRSIFFLINFLWHYTVSSLLPISFSACCMLWSERSRPIRRLYIIHIIWEYWRYQSTPNLVPLYTGNDLSVWFN